MDFYRNRFTFLKQSISPSLFSSCFCLGVILINYLTNQFFCQNQSCVGLRKQKTISVKVFLGYYPMSQLVIHLTRPSRVSSFLLALTQSADEEINIIRSSFLIQVFVQTANYLVAFLSLIADSYQP